MNAQDVLEYLHGLCRDIDEGRPLHLRQLGPTVARLAVPAVLGVSALAFSACGQQHQQTTPEPPVASEVCDDGVDNDQDGDTDCADEDCLDRCRPAVTLYGVPPVPQVPEVCNDGADNDQDGRADCDDADCRDICDIVVAAYAVPMPVSPEVCNDRVDNDQDGDTDCSDADCRGTDLCDAPVLYAAPPQPPSPEVCHDGVDNDGDGFIDWQDPDWHDRPRPAYGVPFR